MPSICSCRKPEPSTSWIVLRRLCPPLCVDQAGAFFVTRAKSNIDAHRVYSAPTDRSTGIFATRQSPWTVLHPSKITRELLGASAGRTPSRQDAGLHHATSSLPWPPPSARFTTKPLVGQVALPQGIKPLERAMSFDLRINRSSEIRHVGERGEDADWIAVSVYVLVAIVKKRLDLDSALHFGYISSFGDPLRDTGAHTSRSTWGGRKQMQRFA